MKEVFLVFVGGGLGSLLRYGIAKCLNPLFQNFPFATFASNSISCLIFGIAISYSLSKNSNLNFIQPLILVGICGGFSTFSTFSWETIVLFKDGNFMMAALNILMNLVICLTAIIVGMKLSKMVF